MDGKDWSVLLAAVYVMESPQDWSTAVHCHGISAADVTSWCKDEEQRDIGLALIDEQVPVFALDLADGDALENQRIVRSAGPLAVLNEASSELADVSSDQTDSDCADGVVPGAVAIVKSCDIQHFDADAVSSELPVAAVVSHSFNTDAAVALREARAIIASTQQLSAFFA